MKYVGTVRDEAYLNYYWKYTYVQKILHGGGGKEARDYQNKCRYHESNVEEMADQILAENLWGE